MLLRVQKKNNLMIKSGMSARPPARARLPALLATSKRRERIGRANNGHFEHFLGFEIITNIYVISIKNFKNQKGNQKNK